MRVGILTSSRADYSIYYPLLKELDNDPLIDFNIIAFGAHLSKKHGYSIDQILEDGFEVPFKVDAIVNGDGPESMALSISLTTKKFTTIWKEEKFDMVFALGDRFEMFAAVTASLPFNINIAHIHGGETTLGAIDNAFRHSISHMSTLHFVSTNSYKERLIKLLGDDKHIYNVGALSYENFLNLELFSTEEFESKFGINLKPKTILCTFHPETVSYQQNVIYIKELGDAMMDLSEFQILITMPNIDTMGGYIRNELEQLIESSRHVFGVETLGTIGYLSALKHSVLVLGNSSSGLVDASFFPKKVINLGARQKGRLRTPNVHDLEIKHETIVQTVRNKIKEVEPEPVFIYGDGNTSGKITEIIKAYS